MGGELKVGATRRVHTLVLGSGAAGLNAAAQLWLHGVRDTLILTEGLRMGASINTGSDKQTYYKLSMCGRESDSPERMARTYFAGGGMHGDLALIEASLSARAFLNLVNLGVPFPRDRFGQFVGYKTDHDPRQRATSIGPYTSREMCRALIGQVRELGVPVLEGRTAIRLLTVQEADGPRAAGVLAVGPGGALEATLAENVVFAVGGPGGLYRASVYPREQTGAIGLALMAGAAARNLPESQYGLASIGFRWNVSGTYMQVIPRFISTAADGVSDEREFLRDAFDDAGAMNSMVFLKGYQWPFDARKVAGGSSLVDILVYIETVQKGRRVFLDYRQNPAGFQFEALSAEARTYLERSNARLPLPIERLRAMNPGAIALYRDHGIDLAREPLEIAVCAQHNNGGLAANGWCESLNVRRLFPIGEVNGSHGIYRPGGSALNAGQVAGFRAAEYIAARCAGRALPAARAGRAARDAVREAAEWAGRCRTAKHTWREEREAVQARMSWAGAHIRAVTDLDRAGLEAWEQVARLERRGCRYGRAGQVREAFQTHQLAFAHAVYLDAIRFAVQSGVGSRGSAIVLDPSGAPVHARLGAEWRIAAENPAFRGRVQETVAASAGNVAHAWRKRAPLPRTDAWFETEWKRFREGAIYDPDPR